MHINGQEIPAHDPKIGRHWGTTYRMDATPARHTQGGEGGMGPVPPQPKFDPNSWSGRGEARRTGSSWHHMLSATGICTFGMGALANFESLIDMMRAVSGWDLTLEELLNYDWERETKGRAYFNEENWLSFVESGKIKRFCDAETLPVTIRRVRHDEIPNVLGRRNRQFRDTYQIQFEYMKKYSEAAGAFYTKTIPALRELGQPENVRIVFWFDN